MDLDFWHCFGRKKLCLISKEIRYLKQKRNMWQTGKQISFFYVFARDSLTQMAVAFKINGRSFSSDIHKFHIRLPQV